MDLEKIKTELEKSYIKLQRYAWFIARNRVDGDVLLHDVMVKLIEKSESIDNDVNLEFYAMRAIKNKFIDGTRTKWKVVNTSSLDTEAETFIDSVIDERAEAYTFGLKKGKVSGIEPGSLPKALKMLKVECKEILIYNVENSYKDISILMDIAIGTVMSRIARCRKQLLKYIEEV